MLLNEIFYSACWVSLISIIWFYTDVVVEYASFLGFGIQMHLDYLSYTIQYPGRGFPDYLYDKALDKAGAFTKLVCKLASCPFCLVFWLSLAAALFVGELILVAPIYVLSLFITFQIKRLI